jgi:hypothetical protein
MISQPRLASRTSVSGTIGMPASAATHGGEERGRNHVAGGRAGTLEGPAREEPRPLAAVDEAAGAGRGKVLPPAA